MMAKFGVRDDGRIVSVSCNAKYEYFTGQGTQGVAVMQD